MRPEEADLVEDSAEELFEDAPCGYLSTRADGTIVRVNRTFESWTGLHREDLVGRRRFSDLLTMGGRMYYETHLGPLLHLQGAAREIAVELRRADGSRLPALVNAVVRPPAPGREPLLRITVFDASDRRRYEDELLRARRHEHDVALALQRGLLAGTPPSDERLELGSTYRPGVSELEVGGDWHDAFWLDAGHDRVALVVGDVVGRGIAAAATMGQLRAAVRALAATCEGPGALLEALDAYSARHDVGTMTTLVFCDLDLRTGVLRYACAGHLPPVVLAPGAGPELLWGGRSAPVDAGPPALARPEARTVLGRGALLVLYTDGLVERRAWPLAHGMDRLVAGLDALRDEPADRLTAALARSLHDPEHADDVCLVAVRRR